MKIDVVMPEMGESIAEGTVAKWLKEAGDAVDRDEAILEITTDKIDSEIPSPGKGVISEILVEEGETVDVGTLLARIETEGDAGAVRSETSKTTPATDSAGSSPETGEARISPVARNVAASHWDHGAGLCIRAERPFVARALRQGLGKRPCRLSSIGWASASRSGLSSMSAWRASMAGPTFSLRPNMLSRRRTSSMPCSYRSVAFST